MMTYMITVHMTQEVNSNGMYHTSPAGSSNLPMGLAQGILS